MNWFIVFFSLINLSLCIYEDQIGKFDWRQTYVGRIRLAQFDTSSTAKRLIVATEENVLAALNLKTGAIVWRQVLESASAGNIELLQLTSQDQVVTVSGSNPYLIRGWEVSTGILYWEWSMTVEDDSRTDFSEWWIHKNHLIHLLPAFGSHLEVTWYNLITGANSGVPSQLPGSWCNEGCIFAAPFYVCVSGGPEEQLLISLDVTANTVQLISKPLSSLLGAGFEGILHPLDGSPVVPGFTVDDKAVVVIQNGEYRVVRSRLAHPTASAAIVSSPDGPILFQAWSEEVRGFSLTAHYVATGVEVANIGPRTTMAALPAPTLAGGVCARPRSETELACRLLAAAADDSHSLLHHNGKVVWTREEALAGVAAVEFVDLPVSDLDAAIESEFDQKEGSVWGAFTRRIQTQLQQLHTLLFEDKSSGGPEPLVRDYFNLHKLIVVVTDAGKIFGLDNLSGEILWQRYEPDLDTENVLIFTRRSARYPPLEPYVTIVGKHQDTGNGLIISLDPIRGVPVGERTLHLDTRLLQCALLPRADNEKLHALVLLDQDENVQVLPGSAAPLVENLFIYVAERDTARVQGYAIVYNGRSVVAQKTWVINLGGSPRSGHRIVAIAAKSPLERVHSAGKVLGDRSVLYKYNNPNLVLFVTQGPDALHKDIVVATVVDCASGAVAAAQSHRRARAAPLAVHADHFMAYLYHNDRQRRSEIATLELYSGASRWAGAGASFSSLAAERAPLVERQASILPAAAAAAAHSATERSLADTHVLLALTTGAIIEIPWAYLEPRRPITPTPEQREEGLIPYTPELPLPAEAVINYNMSLHKVRAIYTAPSGLESTCLVLATGLDLFYTRIAPSKTFDLLKDDFDYHLITIVLIALVVATYCTKYFASRKLLKMAWK